MAIEVIDWVFNNSTSVGTQRLVLLAIADHADKAGCNSFPAISTIARKAGVPNRSATRAIGELITESRLKVEYNAGPRGTNRYTVVMVEGPATPDTTSPPLTPGHPDTTSPRQGDRMTREVNGGDVVSPEPSLTKDLPPKTSSLVGARTPDKPVADKRGTRITADFRPSAEAVAWARSELGFTNEQIRFQTEKFIDYWLAESTQRARKLDWQRAWKNWMRNDLARPARRAGAPTVNKAQSARELAEEMRREEEHQHHG